MNGPKPFSGSREPLALCLAALLFLAWSGIGPHDRVTWLLEVAPVVMGIPLLAATFRPFPLSPLLYRLIFLHAIILMLGGHYTYANVPFGFWMQDIFGFARNHYDRIGHFAQGFIPAMIAREVLLRKTSLVPGRWLFFIVVCICLAFSALYELIEWWTALLFGQAADAFLGTQGDVWDTQWDMFLAMVGAVAAQIILSGIHNRYLGFEKG